MSSLPYSASRPGCVLITDNFPPKGGGVSRYYGGLASSYGSAMQVCSPPAQSAGTYRGGLQFPGATSRLGQVGQAFAAARISRRAEGRAVLLGHPHLGLFSTMMRTAHPLGLFIHGGEWQEVERLRRLLYAIEARCDLIIANSVASASDWVDSRLAGRIVILRPGLDAEWIENGSSAAARRPEISPDRPFRLLSVARLVPRKGISETASVVSGLRRNGVNVELRVVGDGPSLGDLRSAFASDSGVQFLGPLSDSELQISYEWADAFILCPHTLAGGEGYEGFGIVFLEAAAYGLPIIATISGGVAEALVPGGSLTAPSRDWNAVGECVGRLVRMPAAKFAEMRNANLRWASRSGWGRRSDELAASLEERMARVRR